jgi:streptomycin 6-kinase
VPGVGEWGRAFGSYLASGDARIAAALVREGQAMYSRLCESQTRVRLLHGDLHHDNILLDSNRGWVAIDPKGVIGELEYEAGAALRNPHTAPGLFTNPATIERRLACFTQELPLDRARVLGWAFSQAVLAAIWTIEDGLGPQPRDAWIALAGAMRVMLEG